MLLALTAVPVLISGLLALLAPRMSRQLPPSAAVKVLAPACLAAALATGFCLSVLAFNALADVSFIAQFGRWSLTGDPDDGTPPAAAGVVLCVVVTALLIAALQHLARIAIDLMRTSRACRQLQPTSDQLIIVDDVVVDAFAVPGRQGRIVITSAMLESLDQSERAVVVAHERAHLAHHHEVFVQMANLAARADPLLLPVARHVRLLTERWADEEAAAVVQDRDLAARALAKAALARTASARRVGARSVVGLGAATTGITERVLALTRPQPRPRPRLVVIFAGLALAAMVASAWIANTTEDKFERAAGARVGVHQAAGHHNADGVAPSAGGHRLR